MSMIQLSPLSWIKKTQGILAFFPLLFIPSAMAMTQSPECVQVFYDPKEIEYPIYLKNLLGHFQQFQIIADSIDHYQKGQIDRCKATIYMGTNHYMGIPSEFLDDFSSTKQQVAWIGYSIEKLGSTRLADLFGVSYQGGASLNQELLDEESRPTFYRFFHYKGETFEKYGEFTPNHTEFRSSYPMTLLQRINENGKVLAQAEHNGTHDLRPYIIQNQNKFYVADIPLSYRHESDRYLIFADLLFDILDAPPLYPSARPALIRIEDVNVTTPLPKLKSMVQALHNIGVPLQIAFIPIFADPLGVTGHDPTKNGVSIDQVPEYVTALHEFQRLNTSIIWHGVTHQYGSHKNPNGVSADDYEFALASSGKPIPEDSVNYVLDVLNRGWNTWERAAIRPIIWEVPHYTASALDYVLFGKLFSWNYGKIRYAPSILSGLKPGNDSELWFEKSGVQGDLKRRDYFNSLQVQEIGDSSMQFFPYEIYSDYYGQRVLPENLGHPHIAYGNGRPRSLENIVADAKRNRVIRDSWASFFIHVSYIMRMDGQNPESPESGIEKLVKTVRTLKELGYSFQNANEWTQARK